MKKLLLSFFLIGTLTMIVVMARTGSSLKTPATPLGILDLEFAYSLQKTEAVLNAWAPSSGLDNIAAAKTNTWWDFAFLLFYSGFLFLVCKRIAANNKGWFSKAGHTVAHGAIAAGILDILENLGMLLTLYEHGSSAIAFATTFVSVIKWGLAIIAVLYMLTGLIVWVFYRAKNTAS